LSISPGKGLEFEKNVPFKLISEYIEVIGGVKSGMFNNFRKLFFKYLLIIFNIIEGFKLLKSIRTRYSS
jgi:hypothetical protein